MKDKTWKVLAIVFISLFVIETLLFILVSSLGIQMINNEQECSYNICGSEIYDTYFYDYYTKLCYCYINHEIVLERYIGKIELKE